MTSEAFELKGLSKQVSNDFIRGASIRLQERLAREAEERARKEAEEKACQEELQRIREPEAKVVADAVVAAATAEAEAKAKADAEEGTRITKEAAAKANADALTQGEHSNSGFVPLVLKTLEELQKEQQICKKVAKALNQGRSGEPKTQNDTNVEGPSDAGEVKKNEYPKKKNQKCDPNSPTTSKPQKKKKSKTISTHTTTPPKPQEISVYNESSEDTEEHLIISRNRPRASPKPSVNHKNKGTPQKPKPKNDTAAMIAGPSQQETYKEEEH
ncbi:eukaryotic translation initiation factor 4 gamma-like [Lathyrus oleraceus]|uniref:eukaryotic translation initiation factor 4 gamma-like n=1 Tax=Pisum sativum TaxID=3888 RepID=UPI0021CFC009|nr:eukaryotic translation initiation factor 4 gamma-like [Pisum sativum]